jgi:stage III sporulation protein AF
VIIAMMSYLAEWIKHIILLILMATFLDLILPSSNMRKYVKLVVGFLILLLILSPLLHLFQYDPSQMLSAIEGILHTESNLLESEVVSRQVAIEAMQQEEILQEAARKWKAEMKLLLEDEWPVEVVDLQLNVGLEREELFLKRLNISLRLAEDDEDDESVPAVKPIEAVEPVAVQIGNGSSVETALEPTEIEKKIEKEVLKLVQHEWNISEDKIILAWIRR